jgi:hypothetical protein
MHPDLRWSRLPSAATAPRTLLTLCVATALAACGTPPPGRAAEQSAPPSPAQPVPAVAPPPAVAGNALPPPAPAAAAFYAGAEAVALARPPSAPLLAPTLAYAERLRSLSASELAAEQALIGEPGGSVERQMQLALVLAQTHVPADTARALGLLQRLVASTAPEAAELRPLARLLIGRLLEARRLEDQADRLAQQLREAQRRIDVLNDRLEAMRAIERSLTPRTPPALAGTRPLP